MRNLSHLPEERETSCEDVSSLKGDLQWSKDRWIERFAFLEMEKAVVLTGVDAVTASFTEYGCIESFSDIPNLHFLSH